MPCFDHSTGPRGSGTAAPPGYPLLVACVSPAGAVRSQLDATARVGTKVCRAPQWEDMDRSGMAQVPLRQPHA